MVAQATGKQTDAPHRSTCWSSCYWCQRARASHDRVGAPWLGSVPASRPSNERGGRHLTQAICSALLEWPGELVSEEVTSPSPGNEQELCHHGWVCPGSSAPHSLNAKTGLGLHIFAISKRPMVGHFTCLFCTSSWQLFILKGFVCPIVKTFGRFSRPISSRNHE